MYEVRQCFGECFLIRGVGDLASVAEEVLVHEPKPSTRRSIAEERFDQILNFEKEAANVADSRLGGNFWD